MDFDTELIEEIRKNELIYNIMCKDYRHSVRKEKAWTAIAQKLNADKTNCKKRWKSLRDTYKKYLKHCKLKSKDRVKQWKYFDEMCFLDNFKDSKGHPGVRAAASAVRQPVTDEDGEVEEEDDEEEVEEEEPEHYPDEEALFDESFAYEPGLTSATPSNRSVAEVDTNSKNGNSQSSTQQPQQEKDKTSTDLLFESLAKKIQESNLLESEVNAIECKVMALVYSEIEKVRQNELDMSIAEQL